MSKIKQLLQAKAFWSEFSVLSYYFVYYVEYMQAKVFLCFSNCSICYNHSQNI